MTESEVREFMEWSTDPGSSMTLNTLVDVFKSGKSVNGVLPSQESVQDSFEAVQYAKDQMWDAIMSAGSRSNVLR